MSMHAHMYVRSYVHAHECMHLCLCVGMLTRSLISINVSLQHGELWEQGKVGKVPKQTEIPFEVRS